MSINIRFTVVLPDDTALTTGSKTRFMKFLRAFISDPDDAQDIIARAFAALTNDQTLQQFTHQTAVGRVHYNVYQEKV